ADACSSACASAIYARVRTRSTAPRKGNGERDGKGRHAACSPGPASRGLVMATTFKRGWFLVALGAGTSCLPAEQSRLPVGEDAFPDSDPLVDDRLATDNGWPRTIVTG